jgi:hypothetical protein
LLLVETEEAVMRPRPPAGRSPVAGFRCTPALVLVTAVVATVAVAAPRPPRCPGRYLVPHGTPLGPGAAIVLDDAGRVAIAGICPPNRNALRGRARVRARWARCAALRAVRLGAVVADDCMRLAGRLRVGRSRPIAFAAPRSVCGDGVLDAGEECDGAAGCGTACDHDCRCLPRPPASTTTSTTTSTTAATTTTTHPALAGLPADVAGYRTWLRMNAEPIPIHGAADAHFGTKDVWVNQPREVLAPGGIRRLPFPDGTVLLKESTRPGRDFVGLVSIMRKRAGTDPDHGDWEFVEYGRASAGEALAEVGRGEICWTCHAFAASRQQDWVYTTLE